MILPVFAVVNAVEGDWGSALAFGALTAPSVLMNRWAMRRIRERTGHPS
jgi:hypothetical protein